MVIVQASWEAELFKLGELHLVHCLKMAGPLTITLGKDYAQLLLILMMVFKCMSLTKYLYLRGKPNYWTRKWS